LPLVANAHERARLWRVLGIVLVIAAPSITFLAWQSTQQPIQVQEMAERMKGSLPAEQYASALYRGSIAHQTLNDRWKPTGFATLGTIAFLVGVGLLFIGFGPTRRSTQATAPAGSTLQSQ
jgi:hypothetical protein